VADSAGSAADRDHEEFVQRFRATADVSRYRFTEEDHSCWWEVLAGIGLPIDLSVVHPEGTPPPVAVWASGGKFRKYGGPISAETGLPVVIENELLALGVGAQAAVNIDYEVSSDGQEGVRGHAVRLKVVEGDDGRPRVERYGRLHPGDTAPGPVIGYYAVCYNQQLRPVESTSDKGALGQLPADDANIGAGPAAADPAGQGSGGTSGHPVSAEDDLTGSHDPVETEEQAPRHWEGPGPGSEDTNGGPPDAFSARGSEGFSLGDDADAEVLFGQLADALGTLMAPDHDDMEALLAGLVNALAGNGDLDDVFTASDEHGRRIFIDTPLSRNDVDTCRSTLTPLQSQFEERGRGAWFAAIMARLDEVAAHATGDIDLLSLAPDEGGVPSPDSAGNTRSSWQLPLERRTIIRAFVLQVSAGFLFTRVSGDSSGGSGGLFTLGQDVLELAKMSPDMWSRLNRALDEGYEIEYGEVPDGAAGAHVVGDINLHRNLRALNGSSAGVLAHELGHATGVQIDTTADLPRPGESFRDWIERQLRRMFTNEAEANLVRARARHEILVNAGIDIDARQIRDREGVVRLVVGNTFENDTYARVVRGEITLEQARKLVTDHLMEDFEQAYEDNFEDHGVWYRDYSAHYIEEWYRLLEITVRTGLGPEVDALVQKSRSLRDGVAELLNTGWTIRYTESVRAVRHVGDIGGFVDVEDKEILVPAHLTDEPEQAVWLLAALVARARGRAEAVTRQPPTEDMTEDGWIEREVRRQLAPIAADLLSSARTWWEIDQTDGTDIGNYTREFYKTDEDYGALEVIGEVMNGDLPLNEGVMQVLEEMVADRTSPLQRDLRQELADVWRLLYSDPNFMPPEVTPPGTDSGGNYLPTTDSRIGEAEIAAGAAGAAAGRGPGDGEGTDGEDAEPAQAAGAVADESADVAPGAVRTAITRVGNPHQRPGRLLESDDESAQDVRRHAGSAPHRIHPEVQRAADDPDPLLATEPDVTAATESPLLPSSSGRGWCAGLTLHVMAALEAAASNGVSTVEAPGLGDAIWRRGSEGGEFAERGKSRWLGGGDGERSEYPVGSQQDLLVQMEAAVADVLTDEPGSFAVLALDGPGEDFRRDPEADYGRDGYRLLRGGLRGTSHLVVVRNAGTVGEPDVEYIDTGDFTAEQVAALLSGDTGFLEGAWNKLGESGEKWTRVRRITVLKPGEGAISPSTGSASSNFVHGPVNPIEGFGRPSRPEDGGDSSPDQFLRGDTGDSSVRPESATTGGGEPTRTTGGLDPDDVPPAAGPTSVPVDTESARFEKFVGEVVSMYQIAEKRTDGDPVLQHMLSASRAAWNRAVGMLGPQQSALVGAVWRGGDMPGADDREMWRGAARQLAAVLSRGRPPAVRGLYENAVWDAVEDHRGQVRSAVAQLRRGGEFAEFARRRFLEGESLAEIAAAMGRPIREIDRLSSQVVAHLYGLLPPELRTVAADPDARLTDRPQQAADERGGVNDDHSTPRSEPGFEQETVDIEDPIHGPSVVPAAVVRGKFGVDVEALLTSFVLSVADGDRDRVGVVRLEPEWKYAEPSWAVTVEHDGVAENVAYIGLGWFEVDWSGWLSDSARRDRLDAHWKALTGGPSGAGPNHPPLKRLKSSLDKGQGVRTRVQLERHADKLRLTAVNTVEPQQFDAQERFYIRLPWFDPSHIGTAADRVMRRAAPNVDAVEATRARMREQLAAGMSRLGVEGRSEPESIDATLAGHPIPEGAEDDFFAVVQLSVDYKRAVLAADHHRRRNERLTALAERLRSLSSVPSSLLADYLGETGEDFAGALGASDAAAEELREAVAMLKVWIEPAELAPGRLGMERLAGRASRPLTDEEREALEPVVAKAQRAYGRLLRLERMLTEPAASESSSGTGGEHDVSLGFDLEGAATATVQADGADPAVVAQELEINAGDRRIVQRILATQASEGRLSGIRVKFHSGFGRALVDVDGRVLVADPDGRWFGFDGRRIDPGEVHEVRERIRSAALQSDTGGAPSPLGSGADGAAGEDIESGTTGPGGMTGPRVPEGRNRAAETLDNTEPFDPSAERMPETEPKAGLDYPVTHFGTESGADSGSRAGDFERQLGGLLDRAGVDPAGLSTEPRARAAELRAISDAVLESVAGWLGVPPALVDRGLLDFELHRVGLRSDGLDASRPSGENVPDDAELGATIRQLLDLAAAVDIADGIAGSGTRGSRPADDGTSGHILYRADQPRNGCVPRTLAGAGLPVDLSVQLPRWGTDPEEAVWASGGYSIRVDEFGEIKETLALLAGDGTGEVGRVVIFAQHRDPLDPDYENVRVHAYQMIAVRDVPGEPLRFEIDDPNPVPGDGNPVEAYFGMFYDAARQPIPPAGESASATGRFRNLRDSETGGLRDLGDLGAIPEFAVGATVPPIPPADDPAVDGDDPRDEASTTPTDGPSSRDLAGIPGIEDLGGGIFRGGGFLIEKHSDGLRLHRPGSKIIFGRDDHTIAALRVRRTADGRVLIGARRITSSGESADIWADCTGGEQSQLRGARKRMNLDEVADRSLEQQLDEAGFQVLAPGVRRLRCGETDITVVTTAEGRSELFFAAGGPVVDNATSQGQVVGVETTTTALGEEEPALRLRNDWVETTLTSGSCKPTRSRALRPIALADPGLSPTTRRTEDTADILASTGMNGHSKEWLEARMRPGIVIYQDGFDGSEDGFLGFDDDLNQTRAHDNDLLVELDRTCTEFNLTHADLVDALRLCTHLIEVWGLTRFALAADGITYTVRRDADQDSQLSPFGDGSQGSAVYTVTNTATGAACRPSELGIQLVDNYFFYQGPGTPYRLPPDEIIRTFGYLLDAVGGAEALGAAVARVDARYGWQGRPEYDTSQIADPEVREAFERLSPAEQAASWQVYLLDSGERAAAKDAVAARHPVNQRDTDVTHAESEDLAAVLDTVRALLEQPRSDRSADLDRIQRAGELLDTVPDTLLFDEQPNAEAMAEGFAALLTGIRSSGDCDRAITDAVETLYESVIRVARHVPNLRVREDVESRIQEHREWLARMGVDTETASGQNEAGDEGADRQRSDSSGGHAENSDEHPGWSIPSPEPYGTKPWLPGPEGLAGSPSLFGHHPDRQKRPAVPEPVEDGVAPASGQAGTDGSADNGFGAKAWRARLLGSDSAEAFRKCAARIQDIRRLHLRAAAARATDPVVRAELARRAALPSGRARPVGAWGVHYARQGEADWDPAVYPSLVVAAAGLYGHPGAWFEAAIDSVDSSLGDGGESHMVLVRNAVGGDGKEHLMVLDPLDPRITEEVMAEIREGLRDPSEFEVDLRDYPPLAGVGWVTVVPYGMDGLPVHGLAEGRDPELFRGPLNRPAGRRDVPMADPSSESGDTESVGGPDRVELPPSGTVSFVDFGDNAGNGDPTISGGGGSGPWTDLPAADDIAFLVELCSVAGLPVEIRKLPTAGVVIVAGRGGETLNFLVKAGTDDEVSWHGTTEFERNLRLVPIGAGIARRLVADWPQTSRAAVLDWLAAAEELAGTLDGGFIDVWLSGTAGARQFTAEISDAVGHVGAEAVFQETADESSAEGAEAVDRLRALLMPAEAPVAEPAAHQAGLPTWLRVPVGEEPVPWHDTEGVRAWFTRHVEPLLAEERDAQHIPEAADLLAELVATQAEPPQLVDVQLLTVDGFPVLRVSATFAEPAASPALGQLLRSRADRADLHRGDCRIWFEQQLAPGGPRAEVRQSPEADPVICEVIEAWRNGQVPWLWGHDGYGVWWPFPVTWVARRPMIDGAGKNTGIALPSEDDDERIAERWSSLDIRQDHLVYTPVDLSNGPGSRAIAGTPVRAPWAGQPMKVIAGHHGDRGFGIRLEPPSSGALKLHVDGSALGLLAVTDEEFSRAVAADTPQMMIWGCQSEHTADAIVAVLRAAGFTGDVWTAKGNLQHRMTDVLHGVPTAGIAVYRTPNADGTFDPPWVLRPGTEYAGSVESSAIDRSPTGDSVWGILVRFPTVLPG
jgi:hypothetical protein